MVGGEEGVSTLQHACLAARPAGRQPRPPSANTTAPAWDRERGVADWRTLQSRTRHSSSCTGTLQTAANEQTVPLSSSHQITEGFSAMTFHRKPLFYASRLADNEEEVMMKRFSSWPRCG